MYEVNGQWSSLREDWENTGKVEPKLEFRKDMVKDCLA